MKRITFRERTDWREKMRAVGFDFHGFPNDYWTDDAAYEFTYDQIEMVAAATDELWARCLDAVNHVVDRQEFARLGIPEVLWDGISQSWHRGDPTLYGRFDFCFDGTNPPKLYEFNADTPVSLIESAVAQWNWLGEQLPEATQFCLIHEFLIGRWKELQRKRRCSITHFAYHPDSLEDFCTARYLADTAIQAGLSVQLIDVRQVGWNGQYFTDLDEIRIERMFKLYPWHWLTNESFGEHVFKTDLQWLEPAWKMILNSKGILPLLWEMFPNHPNLLEASTSAFSNRPYVEKPMFSWGGDSIVMRDANGNVVEKSEGANKTAGSVMQASCPLPLIGGKHPMVGSWLVGNKSAGIGIREDDKLITTYQSRFVSHYYPTPPPQVGTTSVETTVGEDTHT